MKLTLLMVLLVMVSSPGYTQGQKRQHNKSDSVKAKTNNLTIKESNTKPDVSGGQKSYDSKDSHRAADENSNGGTPNSDNGTPNAGSDNTGIGTPDVTDGIMQDSIDAVIKSEIIKELTIQAKDSQRVRHGISEIMILTLGIILFIFSIIMYYRSVNLLNEVKRVTKGTSPNQHFALIGPIILIASIWIFFWWMEKQGIIFYLASFCLTASTLPYLLGSLNFTNSIFALRRSENESPLLSSESIASLIFSLVAFAANILKIVSFLHESKN